MKIFRDLYSYLKAQPPEGKIFLFVCAFIFLVGLITLINEIFTEPLP